MTTDVRKALGEKAKVEKDRALAKEEVARKALLEVSKGLHGRYHLLIYECARELVHIIEV